MSRRSRGQDTPRISLFPFLAVLICTMGALLVLLVVMAKKAQAQALVEQANTRKQAAEQNDKKNEEAKVKLEAINWRIEMLRQSREKTAQRLNNHRRALGHIEEHIGRLREQLKQLKTSVEQLEALGSDGKKDLALQGELEKLRGQVELAERQLADAMEKARGRRAAYAVVPYEGRHGTRRWPIYLECKHDSIVLQPEGIVFTERDFFGDRGPGNPLAVALRAASEYLVRTGQAGEPYPLLLVRPRGILAYYAARRAMKSWDADFGYEMIGQDWDLEYQPPDEGLATVVRDAVELARRRQESLRAAVLGRGRGGSGQGDSADRYDRFGRGSGSEGDRQDGSDDEGTGSGGRGFGGSNPQSNSTNRAPHSYDSRTNHQPFDSRNEHQAGGSAATAPRSSDAASRAGESGTEGDATSGRPTSLADARGKDWALPDASRGAIAFTRSIRVDCTADAVTIVPDDRRSGPRVIDVRGTTRDSVEQFVSAVWEHMRSWGIAGRGMYWKPVLNLHVAPGGQQRARELQQLLERSGMEVRIQ